MRFSIGCTLAASLAVLPHGTALPYPFQRPRDGYTSIAIRAVDVLQDLGPQLSPQASIVLPTDPGFDNLTARYSEFDRPTFVAVANPGVEADVAVIVKYANQVNIPFLAVNRGHGHARTQGRLQHGLEINIGALSEFQISDDKKSVRAQGGVWGENIIPSLWDAGYVTTSGSCGCVGLLGPGLGGGFGRYMGFYGMVSDSFISLNMVLADGSEVTVSQDENPDLFWAVKGAGHNFGIVTSFVKEIHPRTVESWYYISYLFTQDKLEALTEAVNTQNDLGRQPRELVTGLIIAYVPQISTTEPFIYMTFQYVGSKEQAAPLYAPFDALGPISREEGNAPYPELFARTSTSSADPLCQKGFSHVQYTVGLLRYNVTTQRQIYEHFKEVTTAHPEYVNASVVLETYSVAGVKAIPADSSAYPHREDNILVATNVQYVPDPALDEGAINFAREMRDIWQAGQPERRPNAYVNYAFGDEPLEQVYGYESWRLDRLRNAKRKYDPNGRFNFYNPITY